MAATCQMGYTEICEFKREVKLRYMQKILISVVLLGLAGCQSQPVKEVSVDSLSEQKAPEQPVDDKRKLFTITEQGLGDILQAEWQGQARSFKEAGQLYSRAALETNDPEVVSRAVVIATYNEQWEQVRELSVYWAQLQTEDIKPLEFQLIAGLQLKILSLWNFS